MPAELEEGVETVLDHELLEQRPPEAEADLVVGQDADLAVEVLGDHARPPAELHDVDVGGAAGHGVGEPAGRQAVVDHHGQSGLAGFPGPGGQVEPLGVHRGSPRSR